MLPIWYTTTDQIRSALGLTPEDVADEQIISRGLDKELGIDLTSWLPTHATVYANGGDTSNALQMYCMYYCCGMMIPALKLATPKDISDGKNSVSRFDPVDFDKIQAQMQDRQLYYKRFLLDALSAGSSPAVHVSLFKAVGLATDPVTNK